MDSIFTKKAETQVDFRFLFFNVNGYLYLSINFVGGVLIQFLFLTLIKITRHDILKISTIYHTSCLLGLHLP